MRKDRVLINNVETTGQPCGEKKDLFLISGQSLNGVEI